MTAWIIGHLLATCIGISLGLIGGGGSILAAPILIYIMGVPAKSAFAMTLVIVGTVSIIGAIPHWRQGNVNLKTAALFSPTAMLGAYLGARATFLPIVTPNIQLITFAIVMLIASISMLRKGANQADEFDEIVQLNYEDNEPHKYRWLAIVLEGFVVGIITGFVGIGGGFLVIPALVLLGNTPMKEAIGTSLIILALKSVTGFAGYFGHVFVEWNLLESFTAVASAGILIGTYFTKFFLPKDLEKGFGYFVLVVALFILIKR
ncbi:MULTISPECIES: sulfite exporter TauE/SafE family protein [Aerosakkonema]|uniref:sulfite exporter TauE/SafE family protein n=1 Tax=Aerosakkonema TaxID=1246629 RepID=UPI0035BB43BA